MLACLALALAAPSAASADPVSDCAADGSLDQRYSDAELEEASGNIPSDLDEYSDCRAQIEAAKGGGPQAGAAGPGGFGKEDALGGGSGGGGGDGQGPAGAGSGGAPSAQELEKANAARERARAGVERALGDRNVDTAAAAAVDQADTASGLPLPVLLALIALSLLLAVGAVTRLRRRPGLASALRRAPFGQRRR